MIIQYYEVQKLQNIFQTQVNIWEKIQNATRYSFSKKVSKSSLYSSVFELEYHKYLTYVNTSDISIKIPSSFRD